jgi:hypothetical protein
MMMPAKKEDGDRDRLIEFLKLTEGIEYRTVDVNVLNRPREKNFDYLLQANSGATLALEITWLTDKDETAADEREHHDFVQDKEKFLKLRQILESSMSRAYLPCSISINVPFHVPCERKALNSLPADALAKAKVQLMTAIEGMSVGDSVSVTIDFGSFQTILQIEGIDVGRDINLYSMAGSGLRGGIFDETYFAAKIKNKIPHKNQQLDYKADRRVLFFGNAMPYESPIIRLAISAAITDFTQSSPLDVSNIDEIYVRFGNDKIERVYRSIQS